ncbi:MAG: hypothetical protein QOI42_184 [Frankiaceae bacterium]|nr:hypothetical protein [Frankiaceae bacterium]
MKKRLAALALLLVFIAASAAGASAAPTSTDPPTAAKAAAAWVAHQVNPQGFIPQAGNPALPNLSNSAQAVIALAAAGVGGNQVNALLGYLGNHVDDFVVHGSDDDPGSLAYLILGVAATGADPTDFGPGHVDLVTRLENTRQPSGLFGAASAAFDGAFRQGLSLLALHAAGQSDAAASDWLVDQQCADGSWTSFRDDTTVACPAVDPVNFIGPDTNSTALAALGLKAQGRNARATAGANALLAVRNADGAWGFLSAADQPTDANSTGLVVTALRTINGTQDAQGIAALLALQAGCDADPADIGGIAFQASPDGLVPDMFATNEAILGLAGVALPIESASIAADLPDPCPIAATTTTTTTPTSTTTGPTSVQGLGELARSGTPALTEVGLALMLIGAGAVLVLLAQDRQRRTT